MAETNAIVIENQRPGIPESVWRIGQIGSSIEGYATDISTNIGGLTNFKINTEASDYKIEIYRLGYYGGDGARLVTTIQHHGSTSVQPAAIFDRETGLIDAGNWRITDSWTVPTDAVSGVYIANIIRTDGIQGASQIPFVIRNDQSHSDVVFQTSDTTWQAYNDWGGQSFYESSTQSVGRAFAVSYNRPTAPDNGRNSLMGVEYNAIQWLEKNGYDVSYITGIDTDRYGGLLQNHRIFVDAGHDEYWSAQQRANVEAARDAGVNLAFWSGNEAYWATRWAPSIDVSATAYRTLVSYKESWGDAVDPNAQWTGLWRDARAPGGADPENALTGTIFMVNSERSDTITVDGQYADLRFWANTSIANLDAGQLRTLSPGTLGYEWDVDLDNGFRPAGLIHLSSTRVFVDSLLMQGGNDRQLSSGEATHSLTLYRASSGALVFGAGTIFWAHNLAGASANHDARQAMVNLFADMGAQPGTLEADLVLAIQSNDHAKPTAAVTPFAFTGAAIGQHVTIFGTAADAGGGVVAGVEVSTDAGRTWHLATGTTNWAYAWEPLQVGTYSVQARAVDDSLNIGSPSSQLSIHVGPASLEHKSLGSATLNWDIVDATDVTGDSSLDFVWHNNTNNEVFVWQMQSGQRVAGYSLGSPSPGWSLSATADLTKDGSSDLIWHNETTGEVYFWELSQGQRTSIGSLGYATPPEWEIVKAVDLTGDGYSDLLWHNDTTGEAYLWIMNGTQRVGSKSLGGASQGWSLVDAFDFSNGDADLLWHNTKTGEAYVWVMENGFKTSAGSLGLATLDWRIVETANVSVGGSADVLWHNEKTNEAYVWATRAEQVIEKESLGYTTPGWHIVDSADLTKDGTSDLIWHNEITGEAYVWNYQGDMLLV